MQIAQLAEPIFSLPSDDVLRQVVFEPEAAPKARVVCFSHTLATLGNELNMNTRLALNDASIFLEPSEANIQALMLLGLNGEDFASPVQICH